MGGGHVIGWAATLPVRHRAWMLSQGSSDNVKSSVSRGEAEQQPSLSGLRLRIGHAGLARYRSGHGRLPSVGSAVAPGRTVARSLGVCSLDRGALPWGLPGPASCVSEVPTRNETIRSGNAGRRVGARYRCDGLARWRLRRRLRECTCADTERIDPGSVANKGAVHEGPRICCQICRLSTCPMGVRAKDSWTERRSNPNRLLRHLPFRHPLRAKRVEVHELPMRART
jgi:hypothetical protein